MHPSNQPEIKFVLSLSLISFRHSSQQTQTFSVAIFCCVTQLAVGRRRAGQNRLIILHGRILFEHITSGCAFRFHTLHNFSRSPILFIACGRNVFGPASEKTKNKKTTQITVNPLVVNNLNILPDTIALLS